MTPCPCFRKCLVRAYGLQNRTIQISQIFDMIITVKVIAMATAIRYPILIFGCIILCEKERERERQQKKVETDRLLQDYSK